MAHVRLPFGIHQAVEYLLAIAVIAAGVRSEAPIGMVVIGLVLLAVPATAIGPLAAVRLVDRPAHRIVDAAAAVGLLVVAVLGDALGTASRATLLAVSIAFAAMLWRADYRPARPLRPVELRPEDVAGSQRSEDAGRAAGRAVGKGVVAGKEAVGKGAAAATRGLGRATGAGLKAYKRRKGS